jgi:hypothetical protein
MAKRSWQMAHASNKQWLPSTSAAGSREWIKGDPRCFVFDPGKLGDNRTDL